MYNTYKANKKPTLVSFVQEGNASCKYISPLFSHFSTVVPEATFLSVDTKGKEEIAKMEQVTVIPSYKLFKENKMLFDFSGADGKKLMEMVELALEHKD
ncbi:thioredoxin [Blastocystis sp. ATCC 50177/Nand II]|uniref:Thioredoxin n=1 Tax=Blastocystis sp. subtype 1 (strain ATCC 50177 / NandII) TaxID=478820 RepID=A0A196S5R3_BLAHN|nr:thioredoxin [Blastocystis sp. ATCC 50177/Nand II]